MSIINIDGAKTFKSAVNSFIQLDSNNRFYCTECGKNAVRESTIYKHVVKEHAVEVESATDRIHLQTIKDLIKFSKENFWATFDHLHHVMAQYIVEKKNFFVRMYATSFSYSFEYNAERLIFIEEQTEIVEDLYAKYNETDDDDEFMFEVFPAYIERFKDYMIQNPPTHSSTSECYNVKERIRYAANAEMMRQFSKFAGMMNAIDLYDELQNMLIEEEEWQGLRS